MDEFNNDVIEGTLDFSILNGLGHVSMNEETIERHTEQYESYYNSHQNELENPVQDR